MPVVIKLPRRFRLASLPQLGNSFIYSFAVSHINHPATFPTMGMLLSHSHRLSVSLVTSRSARTQTIGITNDGHVMPV